MMNWKRTILHKRNLILSLVVFGTMLIALSLTAQVPVVAQEGSPLHPLFPLLDANGMNVLDSGNPVSTMQTCGSCHNTEFIASHSYHADAGLSTVLAGDNVGSGRVWETSAGYFGRWDPLSYRYLSPTDDPIVDLTTPEWLQMYGARHVGGGPSVYSRSGQPLIELPIDATNPETSVWADDMQLKTWNWEVSGVVEMNCFLCHTANPDNAARIASLEAGQFGWANSATLASNNVVQQIDGEWTWNTEAFTDNGDLSDEFIAIQDPTSENCGQCHGLVHVDAQVPLTLDVLCEPENQTTLTTGQIISPQQMSNSGVNLHNKENLTRSYDIHAERVLECVDCHYSTNNPVYSREDTDSQPDHLVFDPRRIDLGEYLERPAHDFATGESRAAPDAAFSMRDCADCHDGALEHEWLPYYDRHTSALACETCHVPQLYARAMQTVDWTIINTDSTPIRECRGVEGSDQDIQNLLIMGYTPVLLPRENADGSTVLAPYNMITAWYWVYDNPERPVPLRYLEAAYLDGDTYHPDVVAAFDTDGDGKLRVEELTVNTDTKENLIRARLEAQGLDNPRIMGEVSPYPINHGVTHGEWATKDCQACHTSDSLITEPFLLANQVPQDVIPTFINRSSASLSGDLVINDDGQLYYEPQTNTETLSIYVIGHNSVALVDWLGAILFLGTALGVAGHSSLRYYAARKRVAHTHESQVKRVYMYTLYERQWHWLQTIVILGLIFTGLIIHKPDIFSIFSFRYVVQVHNVFAAILVANAGLAAFYHFASGEIRQYLPQPRGFFYQAIQQATYYIRGIFRGEPHPFEKSPEQKLNPLQQMTYLAILNILLPLQIVTGALIWGAQTWPDVAESVGGLTVLGPVHTLGSWLFASFVVMHVYLTTTAGHTPMAGIRAMMMGWDDVDVPQNTNMREES